MPPLVASPLLVADTITSHRHLSFFPILYPTSQLFDNYSNNAPCNFTALIHHQRLIISPHCFTTNHIPPHHTNHIPPHHTNHIPPHHTNHHFTTPPTTSPHQPHTTSPHHPPFHHTTHHFTTLTTTLHQHHTTISPHFKPFHHHFTNTKPHHRHASAWQSRW